MVLQLPRAAFVALCAQAPAFQLFCTQRLANLLSRARQLHPRHWVARDSACIHRCLPSSSGHRSPADPIPPCAPFWSRCRRRAWARS
jgi:hypothetical protein